MNGLIFLNIVLGVVASLVATIIWIKFSSLYIIQGRQKIAILIEYAISTNNMIENSLEFKYYGIALSQVDKLFDLLFEINSNIAYFNYSPTKRKLIYTLLFESIRTLNFFKHLSAGYSNEQELEARCDKFRLKYFFNIPITECTQKNRNMIMLELIQKLNSTKNVRSFFDDNVLSWDSSKEKRKEIYSNLIDVNSFKYSGQIDYYMRSKGFTHEEYLQFINKYYKLSEL